MEFQKNQELADRQRNARLNKVAVQNPPNAGRQVMPTKNKSVGSTYPGSTTETASVTPLSSQKRTERGRLSSTITTGAFAVTYATPFTTSPVLNINAFRTGSSAIVDFVDADETGFSGVVYDNAGVIQAAGCDINWTATEV